ncbi:ABC-2 type transport system ATP-binding protein [Methanomicrobium sp. W14]|uniref:ATP-binding cassette domain-containing protein n=1 Tax=Methanomicrobium sp. W14 TaxID=2817839 RepID=UPI001AE52C15|nr:ATP-binding cassette domain-containing protein [Methanomicrobium sp. W14]MBP2133457.1 ABC-2 type transport system ATP-binding protein [Methanomicrobium sp. W14]
MAHKPEKIIDVIDLKHKYGDFEAVKGISFYVNKGEIFSFLGPNGAGKSTAINVLITLLKLQEGTVRIAGYDLKSSPELVRKSIGIVFQEITLDRDMTVYETLEFHARLYSVQKDLMNKRIEELLRLVELSDKRDSLIKELSGGMKRRLEIARGLLTRPQVLFLDEPTIGLDPQTRMKTWEYLRDVNKNGTTVFLTTHYMDEADKLSGRISIIDNGRIIATGTPGELKNSLGEDIIYLETSENKKSLEILKSHHGVRSVSEKEGVLVLTSEYDGARILPEILQLLEKNSLKTVSVNLKKPSMDDVFLHYTGTALRDGVKSST